MAQAPRKIVHLDADAFFASVEQVLEPSLRGKPIAVGGAERGIVCSASYEARRLGVRTPMPTAAARRICPGLIMVPGRHGVYSEFSHRMFEIIHDFTPEVERCSIDEGYFELSGRREPIEELTGAIRDRIRKTLQLPVSFGMGSNKLVTQIASKMYKPESFHLVPPGSEAMFLYPLSNRWLPGVGEKTGKALDALGLHNVFHILQAPLSLLERAVGSYARELRQYAAGVDERPVVSIAEDPKSYGQQKTFLEELENRGEVELRLKRMLDELMAKIRADGKYVRTLTVRVRYPGMEEAQGSQSLCEPSCVATDFYPLLKELLTRIWRKPLPLRMAGVKLSQVYRASSVALHLPLFSGRPDGGEARIRLARAVDQLHRTLGQGSIGPARDILHEEKSEKEPPPHLFFEE